MPRRTEPARASGIVGISCDVTAMKAGEAALRRSERR
jgi:hypothetical protein